MRRLGTFRRNNARRSLTGYFRERYQRLRPQILEAQARRRRENPEGRRVIRAASQRRHLARHAFNQARRRALEGATSATLTFQQWVEKLDLFAWCCAYCGRADLLLTIDHKVPLSRGGKHVIGNVVPACGPCNSSKGTRSVQAFLNAGALVVAGEGQTK